MDTLFSEVIREHLELRKQNAGLGRALPLERHGPGTRAADDTDDTAQLDARPDSSWGGTRSFDWGD